MNPAPSTMLPILAARSRDFLCLIEFYASTYVPSATHGFQPTNAVARFATETASYDHSLVDPTVSYFREALSLPSLTRTIGKQSNTCTVRFSNVSKRLASFVLNNTVEGMRLVVRIISRAELLGAQESSLILFVGKCGPPQGFDRKDASITAKQDLGQIEAVIPPRVFQRACPLRFKGTECLGTEVLASKSATYQAALVCNKTFGQCDDYDNTEFFQGTRVVQIEGSFIHRPHEGFLAKLIGLLVPGSGHRRIRVGSSLEDGTPYGKAIPVVLGRWQMEGAPLQFQDIGTSINFLMAFARGPIAAYKNIRCNTVGFTQPLSVTEHYGEYGGASGQAADTVFPEAGFFSRLAYITGYVNGSDIAVEDPSPSISAIVAGIKNDIVQTTSFGTGTINEGEVVGGIGYSGLFFNWTDNPVEQARYVLTDIALLNFGNSFIDQRRTIVTSTYCRGGIRDETNAERLVLPNDQNGAAGVLYHRYHSTGLLVPESYAISSSEFPLAQIGKEANYEYYDPATPPASFALKIFYRTRFTSNIGLLDQKKAIDLLYDVLLPSFRGYLSWNTKGQIAIRCERPPDSILLRASTTAGATSIPVEDVMPWRVAANEEDNALIGKILIGVGLTTSEVRSVTSTVYSTAANSITLVASKTGGIIATASGATLSGGLTTAPAEGTITITGTPVAGDTVTATIDGVNSVYTVLPGSPGIGIGMTSTVAAGLAFAINSNPVTRRYIEARTSSLENIVRLRSKIGSLNISSALVEAHSSAEETIRIAMAFAGKALVHADTTRANVLDASFKYLGSDGQTRYNQFKGTFRNPLRDFAEETVIINDYDLQDATGKITTLEIDLSAVDNFNQASRLLNGAAAKFADGVDFFSWGSNGLALQLEEGDVVCVNDDSGEFINVPVRIESLTVNEKYEVSFKGRIYATSMFNDTVEETDVPLPSGLTNFAAAPPDISFNTTDFPPDGLVKTTTGTLGITSVRGGAIFGESIYPQYAKVSVKRPGDTDFQQITTITPDSSFEATFEFIASVDGPYLVQLEVCNQWGCNTTKPTALIIVGLGTAQGEFDLRMITIASAGVVGPSASGNFVMPMITISGSGTVGPSGAGGFVIP